MKRLLPILFAMLSVFGWAQAPEAFNYQTIVRQDNGNPYVFQQMDFRISILQGSATGNTVYAEEHSLTTNANGQASFKIGLGMVTNGVFSNIDWGIDTYFIKIEARENGSPTFVLMGIEPFASVPYALFAKNTSSNITLWQQDGNNVYYMGGNVGIKTTQPTEALTLGVDNRIKLSTVKNSLTYGALINLRWNAEDAKPGIHFKDASGASKVALSAYKYQTFPNILSNKFSIATTNAAGTLVERFNVPFGANEVDITVTDANLKILGGNTFQVGTDQSSGLAMYYGDVFINGTRKLGIGDKDWITEGTYGNAQFELYRADSDVEFLIHDDAGVNTVGLHLRNGEVDWKIAHNGDFRVKHEEATFMKIDADGNVGIDVESPIAKLDVNGNINVSAGFAYLVGGQGKGAYLPVQNPVAAGDAVGMNPDNGQIGKYTPGDVFLGIAVDKAAFVENYVAGREKDASFALVVSKGQIQGDLSQFQLNGRLVNTTDGQQVGILLSNGQIFLK